MASSVGAGGANKTILGIWVGAGGAWKTTSWSVGAGGVWKAVNLGSATYTGSFTAYNTIDGGGNGYVGDAGSGTFSPSTDSNGKTIALCYDDYAAFAFNGTILQISGFGSDPGQNYFTTATIDGTPRSSASASYFYSAGYATWQWSGGSGIITPGGGRPLVLS